MSIKKLIDKYSSCLIGNPDIDKAVLSTINELEKILVNHNPSEQKLLLTQLVKSIEDKRNNIMQIAITCLCEEYGIIPDKAKDLLKRKTFDMIVPKKLKYAILIQHSCMLYPEFIESYSKNAEAINKMIHALYTLTIMHREKTYDIITEEILVHSLSKSFPIREYTFYGKPYFIFDKYQSVEEIYNAVIDLSNKAYFNFIESEKNDLVISSENTNDATKIKYNNSMIEALDHFMFLYNYVSTRIPFSHLIFDASRGVYIATVVREMENIIKRINWVEYFSSGCIIELESRKTFCAFSNTRDFMNLNSID
jgi:hypothetical protein